MSADDWNPDAGMSPPVQHRPAVPWLVSDDFREAVALTADMLRIRDTVENLFLTSSELEMLYQAYDEQTTLNLVISSSRKYTRFEFPNCRKLKDAILGFLISERCEIIGRPSMYGERVEIAVPRLGNLHHTCRYSDATPL